MKKSSYKVKKETRDVRLTVRFTPSQLEQVKADAASFDYINVTKYVRTVLLEKKLIVRKDRKSDSALYAQINQISANIVRIGNNYNQVVKKLNELVGAKKKNGDPVINSKYLSYYINKLQTDTEAVKRQHDKLIEIVSSSLLGEQ